MTRRRALIAVAATAVLAAPTLGGCSLSLHRLPAPGGVSGPAYQVTAVFRDVSDLTVGAKVKLRGVVIGEVSSIKTADFQARVRLSIEEEFSLPVGTAFQIRFTTPLGEDFVAVTPPVGARPDGPMLDDGATVPVARTSDAPSIEDTFAALSLLLNGGGLDKLHTIVGELHTALAGRGGKARDTLRRLDTVVSRLSAHQPDIANALDGLAELARGLNDGTDLVERALAEFPRTLRVLAGDVTRVRALLDKLATLGDTVTDLLQRGQDDLLADVDALRPTLDALAARRRELVPTFDALIRFGRLFDRAAPGDYLNLWTTVQWLLEAPAQRPQQPATSAASRGTADAVSTLLTGGLR